MIERNERIFHADSTFSSSARQPPPPRDARCRQQRKVFRKACLFFIYGREDLFFTQHLLEISALAMHCTHKKWKDKDAPAPAPFCFRSCVYIRISNVFLYVSISSHAKVPHITASQWRIGETKCFFFYYFENKFHQNVLHELLLLLEIEKSE